MGRVNFRRVQPDHMATQHHAHLATPTLPTLLHPSPHPHHHTPHTRHIPHTHHSESATSTQQQHHALQQGSIGGCPGRRPRQAHPKGREGRRRGQEDPSRPQEAPLQQTHPTTITLDLTSRRSTSGRQRPRCCPTSRRSTRSRTSSGRQRPRCCPSSSRRSTSSGRHRPRCCPTSRRSITSLLCSAPSARRCCTRTISTSLLCSTPSLPISCPQRRRGPVRSG